ncbi:MAG: Tn3 family transposase [SAR324 cluster bacterium]|nr:Tn3 family transposase [SAR324 cluster bacterium]
MANDNRLQIIPRQEIEDIYGLPRFNDEEREYFFSLTSLEEHAMEHYRTPATKSLFHLQLGYFKAKRNFFILEKEVIASDIKYLQKWFPQITPNEIIAVSPATKGRQQKDILKIHGYRLLGKVEREKLGTKAKYCATISIKPAFIFRELLKYLSEHRIVFPSYSTMQDLIGKTILKERQRIDNYFNKKLPSPALRQIESLLSIDEKDYALTKIKKDSKDFSHGQIKGDVKKRNQLLEVYRFSKVHLPKLKISSESVKYYASLIDHYSVKRLTSLPEGSAKLYLTCFAHFKVQKINNNLLKGFIYLVDNYIDEAKEITKDDVYEHKIEGSQKLQNAAEVWGLFTDETIHDRIAFGRVRHKAFSLIHKEAFHEVKQLILEKTFDKEEFYWLAVEKLAQKFKLNLRVIFLNVDFLSRTHNSLARAVLKVKKLLLAGKSLRASTKQLLMGFVPSHLKKYIAPSNEINADRYEFYLYVAIREKLESGDVYSTESLDFRSFEDDLLPKRYFAKHKRNLLRDAGLERFSASAAEYLDFEEKELHEKYLEVNRNFISGKNIHLRKESKKGEDRWKLNYEKVSTSKIPQFLKSVPSIDIFEVMKFINTKIEFSKYFTHLSGNIDRPEIKFLFADLIALGINAGISRMAKMSNLPQSVLFNVFNNFISIENIRKATDAINNATANLPTFPLYSYGDGMVHSSSDGQKFETRYPTMKSRFSTKYFGLNKGVSAYSMLIHNIPANAMVIGANDHESHFVFDIIHNNTTEIQSDQHSTDSHGINKANFFLLNAFGCQFAPRINKPNEKMARLVSFKDLRSYKNCSILPSAKVDRRLIEEEWENIQHILASLATKTTTQSVIVKKLSSHKRQNRTKEAIWELDRIYESKYILDYIDDYAIPQNVQRSLNQVELYHKLRRAIAIANSSSIGAKSDLDLEIWNECSRLLASVIIYYNNLILSTIIENLKENDDEADLSFLDRVSPIAWRHINLFGKYDFDEETRINIDKILERVFEEILAL